MKSAVFFGGGSLIALHAGYSKGPLSKIQFDHYYGVSAGSLWASILGFLGLEKGLEVLAEIQKTSDIFVTKDSIAFAGDLAFRGYDGFILGYGPLEALIKKEIIGKPKVPVTIGRVNSDTMKLQHVTAYPDGTFSVDDSSLGEVKNLDDFHGALLSSCLTYPIVDMFIDGNGNGWMDGGFREGGPVVRALLDGTTEMHICLTGMFSTNSDFTGMTGGRPLECNYRMVLGMANQNVIGSVNSALAKIPGSLTVYQCKGQGTSDNFNQTDIQANIEKASRVVGTLGIALQLEE
ncbi:MAG: patatin-like phospholipase family protein [Rhabdochlamydiaceae bacterium]